MSDPAGGRDGGPLPTTAELEILRILWEGGPRTVRQVHDEQKRKRPVRYTTVLKLLQNLHDKGLVRRDDRHRSHVFESAAEPEAIESRLVDRFVEEVFEGSASELVLRALSGQAHTPDELERIRALAERIADTESR